MSAGSRLVDRALEIGGRAGEYVVIADETSGVHVRWAGNALTVNGSAEERRLTVVAFMSGAAGAASGVVSRGGAVDDAAVSELLRAADQAARRAPPVEDAPTVPVRGTVADDWHDSSPAVPVGALAGFVPALATAFRQADAEHRGLYGYAEQRVHTTCLGSSTGLRLRHVRPGALVDMTARSAGHSASAWEGTAVTDLADVDVTGLDRRLGNRLLWSARRADLSPGRYEVLLSPSCVADLMVSLYHAAGAKDAMDGRTVFSGPSGRTRIGDRLTEAPLTLRSDPAEDALRCAPFVIARAAADTFTRVSAGSVSVFDNGLPLPAAKWINDGVLTALIQSRQTARATGQPLTPKVDNLILEGPPGGRALADMIAGTRRGLLLTSLWYVREVDPRTALLTGVTRDGVHLVVDGEVVGAVGNFRFNESAAGLLERVIEVGRTERCLPREWDDHSVRVAMPPLRVADFTLSAASRAV
ncbi:metallopeptidase TldD-related protein [Actinoallomurus acanthiterrae]